MKNYDIAIIGYGPVGAVTANLFAQKGFNIVVVEPKKDIWNIPRAVHFDGQQSLNLLLTPLPQSETLNKKHEILQTLHEHILKASNAMIMFKTVLESLDLILFEC